MICHPTSHLSSPSASRNLFASFYVERLGDDRCRLGRVPKRIAPVFTAIRFLMAKRHALFRNIFETINMTTVCLTIYVIVVGCRVNVEECCDFSHLDTIINDAIRLIFWVLSRFFYG